MIEAIQYYSMLIRADSLERQAQEAMDNNDYKAYRRLSHESTETRHEAHRLRTEVVKSARQGAAEGFRGPERYQG